MNTKRGSSESFVLWNQLNIGFFFFLFFPDWITELSERYKTAEGARIPVAHGPDERWSGTAALTSAVTGTRTVSVVLRRITSVRH